MIVCFVVNLANATENKNHIYGLWKTQDQRAKVEISPCPTHTQKICGIIVELQEPLDPETGKEKRIN